MPKAYSAKLLDTVSGTYNQNHTTILGRAHVKTLLNGKDAIGPYLPKFVDVFTDTSGAVSFSASAPLTFCSPNGRLYFVNIAGAGLVNIVLYNFNLNTGATTYVGRLQASISAVGTNTLRSLEALNDAGTTNFKISIGIVNSSNVTFGGLYLVTCDLADFQPSGGRVVPFAAGPNQNFAVQHIVETRNSSLHTLTTNFGSFVDGNKLWGMTVPTATTTRWYRFDYTNTQTQDPILITNWQNRGATGYIVNATAHGWLVNDHVTALPPRITSIATGTTTTFTTANAHGFQADERVQVFHTAGAAILPTGVAVATNYYVRSSGLTSTTFELSTTVGGPSISTSGSFTGQAFVGLFPVGHTAASNQFFVSNANLAANTFQYASALSSPGISAVNNTVTTISGTTITCSAVTTALVVGSRVRFWSTGTFPSGISADTDYWVVAQSGSTVQVSATPNGTAISPGSFTGTLTIGLTATGNFYAYNALGQTAELFDYSTNAISGFTGATIANAADFATPNHTTNSGFPCVYFCSSTSHFLGRISELTSGASTWPSLLVQNNLPNTANNTVAPVTLFANWSQYLDRVVSTTTVASGPSRFIIKRVVNTEADFVFGVANNRALEAGVAASPLDGQEVGGVATSNPEVRNGWLILPLTSINQRGALVADLKADAFFDAIDTASTPSDGFITRVINVPAGSFIAAHVQRQLPGETCRPKIQYRTSGFATPTGGWTDLPTDNDMSSVPSATQIQFKCLFPLFESSHARGAQVSEIRVIVQPDNENVDNWEISDEWSDNNTPSRVAFRLKEAYPTVVPQLFFRARDLSNVLLVNHNTTANASNFQYSTDNGTTWLPLGTIPNTVGTLVRYTFTSPPGVDIRPSIRND